MTLPVFTTQTSTQYKTNIDFTLADHETRVGDLESNPNQASTAQGGTGAENGANTWAKLAEFVVDASAEVTGTLRLFVFDTSSAQEDFIEFVVTIFSNSTTGLLATSGSSIVVLTNNNPNVISSNGIKAVSSSTSTGSTVEIWINKLITNRKYEVKEISRSGFTSLSYFTDAAWQSTDPASGAAFEVISDKKDYTFTPVEPGESVVSDSVTTDVDWTTVTPSMASSAIKAYKLRIYGQLSNTSTSTAYQTTSVSSNQTGTRPYNSLSNPSPYAANEVYVLGSGGTERNSAISEVTVPADGSGNFKYAIDRGNIAGCHVRIFVVGYWS